MQVKFTKTKSAEVVGDYKTTAVDQVKEDVDIRLIQICPKIIDSKFSLKGRGIKPLKNVPKRYEVSGKSWEVLKEKYTWTTDF